MTVTREEYRAGLHRGARRRQARRALKGEALAFSQLPLIEKLRTWDRQALGLKKLPKDLHPHVRRRELARRKEAKRAG
jgi:hypothetical protein